MSSELQNGVSRMSKKVHVALNYETWKKLALLKVGEEKKTFDDVVRMLLENFEERRKQNVRERGAAQKN